ncbi:uncharacterized protein E0L32_007539 [Thyridium curvatum]|uniref:DUF803 domain membrane protein n=1 Tax=Thyridium curvatum TaxID=1093900 RepID=A0A507APD6_9PEZI|nr:uncharacterized protein E0L32_007539 [Thyridium curvatum]TPX11802.1 hypothetical protein E0L32_007539 [Thyridium curvatum]
MDAAMGHGAQLLTVANDIYRRANETDTNKTATETRPPVYKVIGISLAVASGLFIGVSFVLKKVGLLKANEKYNEAAGEGYGYLKNFHWWAGMTLMILGEICNFVAYSFTDAILVTPLGALSVVITTILSAIFLKERLSMVGKVACFLCIVGSVVIVMNAPHESAVDNIQQMQKFVITPGFLTYTGLIIVGALIAAFYAGPRWGKKNMLVYISICSWIGGLSVVCTQGLGAAILAQIRGIPQFNQWFMYVLLVFVIGTLLTEIIYLNKALNLFNAALVTPTYYVYFTSTTIITSTILFQGFKGTAQNIVTVVMGFLTICAGVVLLQLSKSAKDVPDSAVFSGDLDQIHTIAEQEQPETEPKADAIRGAAAIVRRFSVARQKMEVEELKRLHEEKMQERLTPVSENGPQYEWDGLRRRRTMIGSQRSRAMTSPTTGQPPFTPPGTAQTNQTHPPLGWTHFPTDEEIAEREGSSTPGILSSIAGTIRSRAKSVVLPGHPEYRPSSSSDPKVQSPMHPVQLTEINVPAGGGRDQRQQQQQQQQGGGTTYYSSSGGGGRHPYGVPADSKTEYEGSQASIPSSSGRRVQFGGDNRQASQSSSSLAVPPTPPPHSARRQFSFQNVFRRHQNQQQQQGQGQQHDGAQDAHQRPRVASRGYSSPQVKDATEEERLGLVKGDSQSLPALPRYGDDGRRISLPMYESESDEDPYDLGGGGGATYTDDKQARYGRGITDSPPRGGGGNQRDGMGRRAYDEGDVEDEKEWEAERTGRGRGRGRSSPDEASSTGQSGGGGGGGRRGSSPPPPPPKHSPPRGGTGAFI